MASFAGTRGANAQILCTLQWTRNSTTAADFRVI